jgi:hypothetical protein
LRRRSPLLIGSLYSGIAGLEVGLLAAFVVGRVLVAVMRGLA